MSRRRGYRFADKDMRQRVNLDPIPVRQSRDGVERRGPLAGDVGIALDRSPVAAERRHREPDPAVADEWTAALRESAA